MSLTTAHIGIGSNLDDPLRHVLRAFGELDALPRSRCTARSPLYWSEPMGPAGQPRYVNGVAVLATALAAETLLTALQDIEDVHQRVRAQRWGPRTLDLDLLLYGGLEICTPNLIIPHPRLHERAFVLYPLHAVAPESVIPGKGAVATLIRTCSPKGLERIEAPDDARLRISR